MVIYVYQAAPNGQARAKEAHKMERIATNTPSSTLLDLLYEWLIAKAAEDEAKSRRINLDEKIEALVQGPQEGSSCAYADGFKVTVTRKFTRTVDVDAYAEHCDEIPSYITPIKTKFEVDMKIYRALESGNPDMFRVAQKFIEIKPAKTAIKVEVLG